MYIRSPTLQPAQGQAVRHQPVVAGDRLRDGIRDMVLDAAIRRMAPPESTVAFSQEAMKAAVLDKAGVKAGDPESARQFLAKFDFNAISPKDLGVVQVTLFAAGMISREDSGPLIGTDMAYEPPLDPYAPMDAIQHFEHMLEVNISAGPNAGRESAIRAADFIKQLASFASSDRSSI